MCELSHLLPTTDTPAGEETGGEMVVSPKVIIGTCFIILAVVALVIFLIGVILHVLYRRWVIYPAHTHTLAKNKIYIILILPVTVNKRTVSIITTLH